MWHDSMWAEASRDVDAEVAERRLATAKVATAEYWPFLAAANSPEEYVERKALAADRIDAVIRSVAGDDEGVFATLSQQVHAALDSDFDVLHEDRTRRQIEAALRAEAESKVECPDCGGTGKVPDMGGGDEGYGDCPTCDGTGKVTQAQADAFLEKEGSRKQAYTPSKDVLNRIQERDPDGGESEPTEADQQAFKDWVVNSFGWAAWKAYEKGGWGETGGPGYEGYEGHTGARKHADLDGRTLKPDFSGSAYCWYGPGGIYGDGAEEIGWCSPEVYRIDGGPEGICGHHAKQLGWLKESSRKTAARIDTLRKILSEHQATQIDGYLVDTTTANLLVTLYDALNEKNKASFDSLPLPKLVDFAWSRTGSRRPFGGDPVAKEAAGSDLTALADLTDEEILEAEAILAESAKKPYYWVKPRGKQFVVVNDAGRVFGTYDSFSEAREQQAALYRKEREGSEQGEAKESAKTASADVPEELAEAAAKFWFGDGATITPNASVTVSDAMDGGSYTLNGTKISKGGEWGLLHARAHDGWVIEFYDKSFARIWEEGGEYVRQGYDGSVSALPKTAASQQTMRCGRCGTTWTTRAQYNLACPECGAEESVERAKQAALEPTVACRKCTAGKAQDGADCDYCDGAGSLTPIMAMVKAADGWEQGITAEAFRRQASYTEETAYSLGRNHGLGQVLPLGSPRVEPEEIRTDANLHAAYMEGYRDGSMTFTMHSSRKQANPYDPATNPYSTSGPGSPSSDFTRDERGDAEVNRQTVTPQTTRPRVKPSTTPLTDRQTGDDTFSGPGSNLPSQQPVSDGASNNVKDHSSNRSAALKQATEAFMAPPPAPTLEQRVAAKVDEVVAGILSSNPGMNREAAVKVAAETIRRFPGMVAQASTTAAPKTKEPVVDVRQAIDRYLKQYWEQKRQLDGHEPQQPKKPEDEKAA